MFEFCCDDDVKLLYIVLHYICTFDCFVWYYYSFLEFQVLLLLHFFVCNIFF